MIGFEHRLRLPMQRSNRTVNSSAESPMRLGAVLPQVDPRSYSVYLVLFAVIPITVIVYQAAGMHLDASWAWSLEVSAALLIFICWMLRRAGHKRISNSIETITVMFVKGAFALVLQYAVLTVPMPLADGILLRADRFLMFDWLAFARVSLKLFSFPVLLFAYNSMTWQTIFILAALAWTRREGRSWQMVTAAVLALATTVVIFPFFPADGSYVLCGLQAPDIPMRPGMCDYREIMHSIKFHGLRNVTPSMATGMIAFPSFHTVAAILLVWAAWPMRLLRFPIFVLNSLMLVATITVGGHYLIDVVAGLGIATAALLISKRIVRNSASSSGATSNRCVPDRVAIS